MGDIFIPSGRIPDIQFTNTSALAPTALYIGPGETIRISINNSFPLAEVKISARMLLTSGGVVPMEYRVYPPSDRSTITYQFELPEGFLLGFRMKTVQNVPTGRCFALAVVARGQFSAASVLQSLCGGYVSDHDEIGWPQVHQKSPRAGPGWLRTIVGTNPAAGAEITETVPTNAYWRVQSIKLELVTDATVANRQVLLQFGDGTNTHVMIDPVGSQTASLSRFHVYAGGLLSKAIVANVYMNPLPNPALLGPGWTISTATVALQAGDNYAAPLMTVEEWIEV